MNRSLELITPHGTDVGAAKTPIRVIGIDLGTTNSSIAQIILKPDDIEIPDVCPVEVRQPTQQGDVHDTVVPSMIALCNGDVYIGEGAKALRPQINRHNLVEKRTLFWDCKNDIGTSRTYHLAPEGYRSAKEVSAQILKYLHCAANEDQTYAIRSSVVTIPASFQSAQRNETQEAAALANLGVKDGGLLDEPTAAYIAYMVENGERLATDLNEPRNLLVFDFGGGTCDVSILRLHPPRPGESIDMEPLSVSRYCRLGGGDIDRAIVLEVLLPQLLEQNRLAPAELDYDAKRNHIFPSLLGAAERLKVKLSDEIARLRKFGHDPGKFLKEPIMLPNNYP